jgi:DNA-binding NtrC family response regulator
MDPLRTILIASADRKQLCELTEILKRMELDVICTPTVSECQDVLTKQTSALVFCDRTFADGDYRDLMNAARSVNSEARFVVISRQVDWGEFMEANRAGAFHVMSAPYCPREVEWVIAQAKRYDRRIMKQFLRTDSVYRARPASKSA